MDNTKPQDQAKTTVEPKVEATVELVERTIATLEISTVDPALLQGNRQTTSKAVPSGTSNPYQAVVDASNANASNQVDVGAPSQAALIQGQPTPAPVTSVTKTKKIPLLPARVSNPTNNTTAGATIPAVNSGTNYSASVGVPQFQNQGPQQQAYGPMVNPPQWSTQPNYSSYNGPYSTPSLGQNQYQGMNNFPSGGYPAANMNNTNSVPNVQPLNPYLNGAPIGSPYPMQYQYSQYGVPMNSNFAPNPAPYMMNTPQAQSFVPMDQRRVLIYGYYIHLPLQINGQGPYYAVKVGLMKYPGSRFNNSKVPWKGGLTLPTTRKLQAFQRNRENGNSWNICLSCIDFHNSHLLFLEEGFADDEKTIRAHLLAKFGGFPLSRRTINSLLAAVQNAQNPDMSNTGPTEFIALGESAIIKIKNAFAAGEISLLSLPIRLIVGGQQIVLRDTAILDFNDEDDEDEDEESDE
eukprot:TRINITY_DN822_c0_g1_i1.p1 TRINITY_DN822_c0_g1~~TRINITY_DN822_c0_g1_i1.p1  ORF type:complete len:464 (+),score=34.39 TRINITY_DN822_c0_g1_i1:53-1444(+)